MAVSARSRHRSSPRDGRRSPEQYYNPQEARAATHKSGRSIPHKQSTESGTTVRQEAGTLAHIIAYSVARWPTTRPRKAGTRRIDHQPRTHEPEGLDLELESNQNRSSDTLVIGCTGRLPYWLIVCTAAGNRTHIRRYTHRHSLNVITRNTGVGINPHEAGTGPQEADTTWVTGASTTTDASVAADVSNQPTRGTSANGRRIGPQTETQEARRLTGAGKTGGVA